VALNHTILATKMVMPQLLETIEGSFLIRVNY